MLTGGLVGVEAILDKRTGWVKGRRGRGSLAMYLIKNNYGVNYTYCIIQISPKLYSK
jgi:hypothetical protein